MWALLTLWGSLGLMLGLVVGVAFGYEWRASRDPEIHPVQPSHVRVLRDQPYDWEREA